MVPGPFQSQEDAAMPAAHRNPYSLGAAALGLPAALAPAHTDERLCTASMKRVGGQVLR